MPCTDKVMPDFEKARTVLEYDKILDMLADAAQTEGAKQRVRALSPQVTLSRVHSLQAQTTEAKHLISVKGLPPFGKVRETAGIVDRADKGAVLSARELLDTAEVLRTARRLLDYRQTNAEREGNASPLDEFFDGLEANRFLEERITRAIPSEESIADEASPALADIRRHMRQTNSKIKDLLQTYTAGHTASKYLQDNIVTQRNGRYVVPVKAEYKNEVKGLVHDTSSSGATLFIEPLAVVEANNELRVLEANEAKEIERILAELSALVSDFGSQIRTDYDIITEIACIFARAELSFRMHAVPPEIREEGGILLKRARHPLLAAGSVVPIDVELGVSFDTLVITGPNTGGKTVTLKTLGLFAMMAQTGLHLPVSENSKICIFENIFADIGDEQSIEQSLSTFSSHMKNIVRIMGKVTRRSLVLFDELGAGTDPVEGAALAVAVLESVRECGALCAATTHYAELKVYALETPGVCNASCEFDLQTLRPTYRLLLGLPGKSNAFAISEKLGLPQRIVARAAERLSSENKRFEDVLEQLDRSRTEMEAHEREAAESKRAFEAYRRETEQELERLRAEAEKELENAREKAYRMVESAKRSSDFIMEQMEALQKKKDSRRLSEDMEHARRAVREKLREMEPEVNPVQIRRVETYEVPQSLKAGDEVLLVNLNRTGVVLEAPDKDGSVTVQAGPLKTRTKLENLKLVGKNKEAMEKSGPRRSGARSPDAVLGRSFSPEIDLRGQNGEDAWFMVDKYLDDARMAGVESVRLIHGKGTGALRKALWGFLKKDTRVSAFRVGAWGEGDTGVTVVELK